MTPTPCLALRRLCQSKQSLMNWLLSQAGLTLPLPLQPGSHLSWRRKASHEWGKTKLEKGSCVHLKEARTMFCSIVLGDPSFTTLSPLIPLFTPFIFTSPSLLLSSPSLPFTPTTLLVTSPSLPLISPFPPETFPSLPTPSDSPLLAPFSPLMLPLLPLLPPCSPLRLLMLPLLPRRLALLASSTSSLFLMFLSTSVSSLTFRLARFDEVVEEEVRALLLTTSLLREEELPPMRCMCGGREEGGFSLFRHDSLWEL